MTDAKPFELDKKELLKDCPFAFKGLAGAFIDYINHLDSNHDGKADLAQIAPFVIKAMPVVSALAPLIDWEKLIKSLLSKFAIDEKAAEEHAVKLIAIAASVSKEFPEVAQA